MYDIFINGMPVIVIQKELLPVRYIQKRTHRKKRINKKWRKRYGFNLVRNENVAYVFEDPFGGRQLLVSQKVYDMLVRNADMR